MKKELVTGLQARLELVSSRLKALEIERESLQKEETSLITLIGVYKAQGNYDSIEEERNVTEAILGTATKTELVKRTTTGTVKHTTGKTGRTKHEQNIYDVFMLYDNEPMSVSTFTERYNEYLNTSYVVGTVANPLRILADSGKLLRSYKDGEQVYIWNV
jgi:hypothetical protein